MAGCVWPPETTSAALTQIKASVSQVRQAGTMAHYTVDEMQADDVEEAFVLARLALPELTLDDWRRGLQERDRQGCGAVVARDTAGHMRGLALYRTAPRIGRSNSLQIERLIAFDLMAPQTVAEALLSHIIKRAHSLGCTALSIDRPLDLPSETAIKALVASGAGVLHQVF